MRARALSLLVIAYLSVSARLEAQQLRGQVVLPDSIARAAGIVIVATDARGGVTRALSGLNGDFLLQLPHAGQYGVQALRLGFRPTALPPVTVAENESKTLRIVLGDDLVSLAAVTVRGENVCRIRQDSGQLVARMWQEARTAIAATQLSASDEPLVARWMEFDSLGDEHAKMRSGRVAVRNGATNAVFRSASADSLEQLGYVFEGRGGLLYQAPDAAVLLSDSFARLHCFFALPPSQEHPDWIGVGFQPAAERPGLADIEGTLWLDRASAELRLLEFRYVSLPRGLGAVQSGGTVEFRRLGTGNWIISRWNVRVPRAVRVTGLRRIGSFYAVNAMQFGGGVVTEIRHAGVLLFNAPRQAGRLLGVFDDATGEPVAGAEVINVEANTKAITSVSGAVSLAFLGGDSAVVQVRKMGYHTQLVSVPVPTDTVPITVVLTPLGALLPKVITSAKGAGPGRLAEFEQRRQAGIGQYITAEDLDKVISQDVGGVLQRLAGLQITHSSSMGAAWVVGGRGRQSLDRQCPILDPYDIARGATCACYAAVFLDGVQVYGGQDGESLFDVNSLSPKEIAGIEYYSGGASMPSQFGGTRPTCGAVLIWTR